LKAQLKKGDPREDKKGGGGIGRRQPVSSEEDRKKKVRIKLLREKRNLARYYGSIKGKKIERNLFTTPVGARRASFKKKPRHRRSRYLALSRKIRLKNG